MTTLPGGVYDRYGTVSPLSAHPTGLKTVESGLSLNGRPIRLLSGAIHYFRVHPAYWSDRLLKLRALGCNCVETYVPWNLHEPRRGQWDFGEGVEDLSPFLNLVGFLQEAKRQDLLVILRPGPYICSEWDFGGLPRDTQHLVTMYELMKSLVPTDQVLYFTSDSALYYGDLGSIPEVLQTVNTQLEAVKGLKEIRLLQPHGPLVVMEFWTGWFDHWLEPYRNRWPLPEFVSSYKDQLKAEASVNFYMFHGGTNFGFMAGASVQDKWPYYAPDVTSYDYDCLLSENGDYTKKYYAAKELIHQICTDMDLTCPVPPQQTPSALYPDLQLTRKMTLDCILQQVAAIQSENVLAMEDLPYNEGNGQSFGYIVYRTTVIVPEGGATLTLKGHVRDLGLLLLDGHLISRCPRTPADLNGFGVWVNKNTTLDIPALYSGQRHLDLLVENLGRVNYGKPHHFTVKKGLSEGPVLFDGQILKDWTIFPLEFKSDWVKGLTGWQQYFEQDTQEDGPILLEGDLELVSQPQDTFVDATNWGKGIVLVNGFNLGRFWCVGPQRTLYLPGPLLKKGMNKITVWSQYGGRGTLKFEQLPDLGADNPSGLTPGGGGDLINIEIPE
ncbi:Beta-galactosidase-1-like protein 2-like [Homarus americanus]|uniref:Beta-galactosidase-1-like protein 2-like n=1 Tax=Homarus americanus TaxID=6706 RepID=A0A8J5MLE3_HOMAM|nr:Beta-galactosidase-1-like protein 2-like [Homarus americanus]